MKYKWLNKKSNNNLIIFFNGWGMDENVVKHLEYDDFDVLMFYDYNTLDTDFIFDNTKEYQKINLISWSMGVMIATYFATKLSNLNKSVAINGTLKPIDTDFGIHPKIYDLTIKRFNEQSCEKFINSMFSDKNLLENIENSRELDEQLSELIAIKNYSANSNFKYNKVLISNDDKIIPTKSQVNFWKTEPNISSGHCPFFLFTKWSELL